MLASNYSQPFDIRIQNSDPDLFDFKQFINLPSTRRLIHVGKNPFFDSTQNVYNALAEELYTSATPDIEFLLRHYQILLYNGNMDMIVNAAGLTKYINNLQWDGARQFKKTKRIFYQDEKDFIGYLKKHGNLKHLTMRNAGHLVPVDQPKWALKMIKDFINGSL